MQSRIRERNCLKNMKQRCLNTKHKDYPRYGGRGIYICPEWIESFQNFLQDMGPSPGEGWEIDRRDNDDGYHAHNCRWVRKQVNSLNRSTTKFITFNGETLSQQEWADRIGIDEACLRRRLKKWSLEDALTRPKRGKRK